MNEIINPYIAGAPVVETSMFFGREAVFSWIERSLAGKYVDHILVLHGQRRVGKTSVLKQIPNFLPDKYIQVFFDLQGRTNTSLDRFLWWLAREIARTIKQERGINIPRPDRADFSADPEYLVNEFLPGLRPQLGDQVLLLTFDEFDTLDRPDIQETLARPLIETLRRLMEVDWLNFIFSIGSSGDKLENMQASYTDFFKSALYRKISFLTPDDCTRLITKPVEGVIQYERKAVDKITEITSGHPYFTQLMCHELFSLCQKTGARRIQTTEVESVLEDVIERGTVNLKFVWDEASDLEKWILAGLAQIEGGRTTHKLAQLLRSQRVRFSESDLNSGLIHLRDKDVITQDNHFIIQLLRMWLQANRPMDRVREELVEVNPIANRYIEIGDEYRDLDQAEEAIESYQQALKVNPGNLKAQSNIASVYLAQGAYQEAAAAFEQAMKIDDEDVVTRTGTCDANLALGDQARVGGEIEAAIEFYQKILVINPAHSDARQRLADIFRARAEQFLTAEQDDQALSAFNQAMGFTPEDDHLSARYQAVLAQKKNKAITRWLDKAERALARQHWDEAAERVVEALKLDPENGELKSKLLEVKDAPRQHKIQQYKREAEQALARGSFEKAIGAIETLVLLAPEDPHLAEWLESTKTDQFKARLKVYGDQAESAIAGGDWAAAIAARKAALKLSPDDPNLAQELADTQAAQLQFELDDLERQAVQAIKQGDWERAIQAREAALKRSPGDPVLAKAVADTQEAWLQAQLETLKTTASEALAQGSWDAAIESIKAAIELAPGDPSWAAQLSEIESARHQAKLNILRVETDQARAAGDWDAALAALGKYLELEPGEARIQAEIDAIREEKHQSQLAAFKTQAVNATAGEKWEAAVQAWEGYLALDPEDQAEADKQLQYARKYAKISDHYTKAQQAIRKKRYGRAIELLQGIIAQDPTYKSTSRLLVEAVEANKAIPMWRKPWVYGSLGTLVVVVLGVIFGPQLWQLVTSNLQASPSVVEMTEAVTEEEEDPSPTATPHPAQAFASPVLAAIADTEPDFAEDFSTPQDYWDDLNIFEDSQVQVPLSDMVSDGVLRLIDEDPNKWFNFSPDLIAGENFVLQFDFMSDGTARDTTVSLFIRSSQSDHVNFFDLQMNGYWRILETGPGSDEKILEEGNVQLDSNQFYTLRLIVVDDQFAIYLNDEPLAVIEDAHFSGEVNTLSVYTDTFKWLSIGNLQVDLDNIKFWNLDGEKDEEQEVSITTEEPTPAPTEEPQAPYKPKLDYIDAHPPAFEDDFSAPDMVWGSTSEGLAIYALVDGGELIISDHAEDVDWTADHAVPGLTFPTNNLFNATNFALQFDFAFDGLDEIGVQFRSTNNQSTYYQVMFSSFGEWQLTQNQDEIYLAGDSNSRLGINNTLLLIVHDQNLAIYLNDRLLYEGDDLTISGTSNRISVSGPHGSKGRFDNVKYWDLEEVEFSSPEVDAQPVEGLLYSKQVFQGAFTDLDWGGNGLIAAIGAENSAVILDAPTGEISQDFSDPEQVFRALTWHPNGETLTLGTASGILRFYRFQNSWQGPWDIYTLTYYGGINDIGYTSNGTKLAAVADGQYDEYGGYVGIWDTKDNNRDFVLKYFIHDDAQGVDWMPDGNTFLTVGTGHHGGGIPGLRLNTVDNIYEYTKLSDLIQPFDISPDGSYLATYTFSKVEILTEFEDLQLSFLHGAKMNDIAWSPDSRYLATAGVDGILKIWDISNNLGKSKPDPIQSLTAGVEITTVVWSPDGTQLAAGDADGALWIWNLDGVEIGGQEDEAIEEDSFSQVALKYIESQTTSFEDDFSSADRLVWGYTSEITPIDDELVYGGELTVTDHTDQPGGGVPNDHAVPGLTFPTNGLFNAENFALQFDFSFLTGNPVKEIGVQFRYPYNQKTGYEINISRNGTWTLTQNDGTTSISNGLSSLNSKYNSCLLIVKDQNLAIFLNDELLYKANDLDYFGSFTEITVLGETHGSEVKFDNFKYWNLDGIDFNVHQGMCSMTPNPFTFGNPIRDPARFYGRREDIRQVVNRLRSSAHESTSVVGERRIGKTSLLKHLDNPDIAAGLGMPQDEYCLVYIDFQGLTDITPQRFWQRVLRKMERSICLPELVPEIQAVRKMGGFDLFDLEDVFEIISDAGLTIVLLLDEFEYVTQNPNFGSDFFGGLRALAIHQNLPLVTATRRELVDLCHSDEIKGSPFFNIFANVVLKPFSREEVYQMLDGYLAETGLTFSAQEKELVIGLGGGYPFFIQMAGSYLVDTKHKGFEGDDLLREVYASFDSQSDSHFTYMWSHSSESEKITLLAVVSLDRQKPTKKTIPTLENLAAIHSRVHLDVPELGKRGLLLENRAAGTYRLLSPSLERWIAREISAEPGEEESQANVQAWLAAGGRDELEPVSGLLPKFKKKYWPVVSGMALDLSLELIGAVTWEILTKGAL